MVSIVKAMLHTKSWQTGPAIILIGLTAILAGCAHHSTATLPPAPSTVPTVQSGPTPQPPTKRPSRKPTHPKPTPVVKRNAPFRYVVKKGDTLWALAQRFLKSPWLWPEIWYENPQIKNPHLIYPGDIITLTYPNGKPRLTIHRHGQVIASTSRTLARKVLKPKVLRTPLSRAIPTLPYSAIAPLLGNPGVMTNRQYHHAPYVLEPEGHRLMAAAPTDIFARDIPSAEDVKGEEFAIIHKGKALVDPSTGRHLGYLTTRVGRARVISPGDPTTLALYENHREVMAGDRLVPIKTGPVNANFPMLYPKHAVHGRIIAVVGGINQVGQYQVVVINQGSHNGLRVGDILAALTAHETVHDPYAHGNLSSNVALPTRTKGQMILFRVFPHVSYALILHATRAIYTGDRVSNAS